MTTRARAKPVLCAVRGRSPAKRLKRRRTHARTRRLRYAMRIARKSQPTFFITISHHRQLSVERSIVTDLRPDTTDSPQHHRRSDTVKPFAFWSPISRHNLWAQTDDLSLVVLRMGAPSVAAA